jgi:O-antigen chain-terminating methyltransferase
VTSTLVQYLQHVLPVDGRTRPRLLRLATTRAELVLEAFDRRQESLGRRLEGLLALRDRVEVLSEEMSAIRSTLAADAPPPAAAAGAAARAAEDAHYVAFENRFRGERADLRERLAGYVELFDGPRSRRRPRLRAAASSSSCCARKGIASRGVEGNAQAVAVCRDRGLDVVEGDLVDFLRAQPAGSLGGVFAAQVVEHLPPRGPPGDARGSPSRAPPGRPLVLETVNTRSVIGFLEVYLRDLTHRTPLHPDT